MNYLIISPAMDEIKEIEGADIYDAVDSFKSSVWEQGWDADGRVDRQYGDWMIFEKYSPTEMVSRGTVRNPQVETGEEKPYAFRYWICRKRAGRTDETINDNVLSIRINPTVVSFEFVMTVVKQKALLAYQKTNQLSEIEPDIYVTASVSFS